MHRQDASKTYPVTYPKNVSPRWALWLPLMGIVAAIKMSRRDNFGGAGHEPPPVPTYIYTGCYTD